MKNFIYLLLFYTEEDFIAHIVGAAAAWHLSAHDNLCCLVVGYVLRSVAVHWSICLKLVRVTTFSEYVTGFAWFPTLVKTHFDGDWHCKDTRPTYSCWTINLCFGPSHHLTKFGRRVFPCPVCSEIWFFPGDQLSWWRFSLDFSVFTIKWWFVTLKEATSTFTC